MKSNTFLEVDFGCHKRELLTSQDNLVINLSQLNFVELGNFKLKRERNLVRTVWHGRSELA